MHLSYGPAALRGESVVTSEVEIPVEYQGALADHAAVREEMERLVWEHVEAWATEKAEKSTSAV